MNAPDATAPDRSGAKPFLDHLEDLRWTILRCLGALAVGMLVCLPLAPSLFAMLRAPLRMVTDEPDRFLRSLEIGGAFSISLKLAGWGGLLLSSPLQVLFIGRFIFPGLYEHEKRVVWRAAGVGALLFALGVALGYTYALPVALKMMWNVHTWMGVRPEWTVTNYLAFALPFLIGFGLIFELPVLLTALGCLGVLTSGQLRANRRYAIVAALVLGAVLTPPDVFSQVLMAGPLILLYEVSIGLVHAAERRARAGA